MISIYFYLINDESDNVENENYDESDNDYDKLLITGNLSQAIFLTRIKLLQGEIIIY